MGSNLIGHKPCFAMLRRSRRRMRRQVVRGQLSVSGEWRDPPVSIRGYPCHPWLNSPVSRIQHREPFAHFVLLWFLSSQHLSISASLLIPNWRQRRLFPSQDFRIMAYNFPTTSSKTAGSALSMNFASLTFQSKLFT